MQKASVRDKGKRIHSLDNLRTFMIFLVVLVHAGGVYENSGIWSFFWIVDDSAINGLAGVLNRIADIFVMSVIFFISGYLTPLSLKNKSTGQFIQTKFRRLVVPWLIAVFTLIPLYKFIFLYSRNLPQEHWTSYFHFSNGIFSQNWLWFLPVLFIFDMLYLLSGKFNLKLPDINIRKGVGIVFSLGLIFSFTMDMLNLQGWTKTALLDFQNERLLIYFMIFLLGGLCYRQKIFNAKPERKKLYLAVLFTIWIPVSIYSRFNIQASVYPGSFIFSKMADMLILWTSFHLSLFGVLYLLVQTFRFFLDHTGKFATMLNLNSYNVYIIHVIVLGYIALILLNSAIPSLLKYFVLVVSTYTVSNVFVYTYRKAIKPMILLKKGNAKMKTVTTTLLLVLLGFTSGCGMNKQEASENTQPSRPPVVSLHIAALQGNIEAVRQHIQAGSDLNIKDEYGSSPLIIAITFGKTDVAEALIEAGADLTVANNEGSTPLHIAAFFCRTEIVQTLLDKGADTQARNMQGSTPLDVVSTPFENVKGIYEAIENDLKPLGLILDYEQIQATRPQIADMLS